MTPQQTKIALIAGTLVVVMAGMATLNRTFSNKDGSADGRVNGKDGVDVTQSRLGTTGGSGGSSANDNANDPTKSAKAKSGSSLMSDKDLAAIVDAATSTAVPIETEAETRERERYEKAMANQFKYRKLDPDKIKPVELAPALDQTSKDYQIPDNLLAAMMYVETGGTHRDGDHSMEAGYGVMNLRESNLVDTLGEGAALLGKSKEDLLYNQSDNVKAAGALLRSYYDDAIANGLSSSEAWYAAVSQYSGRSDPDLAAALADETAGWLMKGFELHLSDGGGDIMIPPNTNPPFLPKNWKLVGMQPPSAGGSPQVSAGSFPPNTQGYGSASGGSQVTP